jgi:ATP-dependent DNA helicase RecQ
VKVSSKATTTASTPGYSYLAERDGHAAVDGDYDQDLFDILKQLRIRESKRLGVAPYIVFGDKALRGMCVTKPITKAAFLKINGVGEKKLKKFGKKFMEAIQDYEQ